jgi:hypothetical protein
MSDNSLDGLLGKTEPDRPRVGDDLGHIKVTAGQSERGRVGAMGHAIVGFLLLAPALPPWAGGMSSPAFGLLFVCWCIGLTLWWRFVKDELLVLPDALVVVCWHRGRRTRRTLAMTSIEHAAVVPRSFGSSALRLVQHDGTPTSLVLGMSEDHDVIATWLNTRLTRVDSCADVGIPNALCDLRAASAVWAAQGV